MYPVSEQFLTKIKSSSRDINARVKIGATTIPVDGVIRFSIEESFGSNKIPTIGGATSTLLDLEVINTYLVGVALVNVAIKPEVALLVNGVYEWVPLGTFYADNGDVSIGKLTTEIQCFDMMDVLDRYSYDTTLVYPQSVEAILADIAVNYPVVFSGYIPVIHDLARYIDLETFTYSSLEVKKYGDFFISGERLATVNGDRLQTLAGDNILVTTGISKKPEGTLRQVLSKIAFKLGANVLFNRDGECTFKFLEESGFGFDAENYIEYKLLSDSPSTITQLAVYESSEDEVPLVSGTNIGVSLNVTTTVVDTQSELDNIYSKTFPFSFYSYNMRVQGMPQLEIGDLYEFTDIDNNIYEFAVVFHKLEFNGGLTSTFNVSSPDVSTQSVSIDQTTGSIGESIVKVSKTLAEAIRNSSSLITGNQGGHVLFKLDANNKPQEIIILGDTDDINTAQQVWRWNSGGLGFSSTGYNGEYGLALTADGQIVADFITAGSLRADRISGGTLRMGSYNDQDGEIIILDSLGRQVVKIDKNGMIIDMFYNEVGDPTNQFTIRDGLTGDELLYIGASGELYYYGVASFENGLYSEGQEVWHRGNTTVDANGFIKAL